MGFWESGGRCGGNGGEKRPPTVEPGPCHVSLMLTRLTAENGCSFLLLYSSSLLLVVTPFVTSSDALVPFVASCY